MIAVPRWDSRPQTFAEGAAIVNDLRFPGIKGF
jgi:hypothetical protein